MPSETLTKLIRGQPEVEAASKKQYTQQSRIGFLKHGYWGPYSF